ncbi:MAG: HAD family hydrolase [Candidatus Vogelbacteria bacterium]|nr:HAD family hydrolase [Candidatus Vogelbacteria bacterium]
MESSKPKHVALDFDNTLAYFEGGREGIFDLFITLNIPRDVVEVAYKATKRSGGFNIDKLVDEIEKILKKSIDEVKVKVLFSKWLERSLKLYPDTEDLVANLKKKGGSFSIVSVGDQSYQEQKIKLLGLNPVSINIVPTVGDKPTILQKLVLETGRPIIYIDDKATELDSIRKCLNEEDVQTIRIIRDDSPYKEEKSKYKHKEITNLGEVKF